MKHHIDPYEETQLAVLAKDAFESDEFDFGITRVDLASDSIIWPGVTSREHTLPGVGPQILSRPRRTARGTDLPDVVPDAWWPPKNGKLGE